VLEFSVVILALIFLLLEAFFSGSETAIISANWAKLRLSASKGDNRAKLALRLLTRSEQLLATTLIGTNIAVVTVTTLATWLVARHIPTGWSESLVATLLMTPVILVFAELIPKCVCRVRADGMTLHIARPLRLAQRLLYVIIAVAGGITRALLWLLPGRRGTTTIDVSREELKALAQIGEEHGVLAPQTRRMIQSVFDLGDRLASTVMVPLSRMASVPLQSTIEDVQSLAQRVGFSRFPVYEGPRENIVGIINLTDILYSSADPGTPIDGFVRRQIARIPRSKSVGALLTEFRFSQVPLAIVVDDAGRALGSLSPQDLLEEIVGSIRDERAR
jgi:CBS domain containing-hemolysin-like protein